MHQKKWIVWSVFVLFVFLLLPLVVGARRAAPQLVDAPVTTITVNTGVDIDNSKSKDCTSNPSECTLRRAIVEARGLPPEDRPVLIDFDIPATVEEGYNGTLNAWELDILASTDQSVFRTLEGGQITIDGGTQPGGRNDGPKIILVGPGTGNKDGIILGTNASGSHDSNAISGLAFQNFKTHLYVNSNENMIADNWFGLISDGTAPYLRNGDAQDGSGSGAISLSSGVSNNTITENVFLGLDGTAVTLRGDHNIFEHNFVGTDADGEVPGKMTDPSLICSPVDWLGGGGLTVDGEYQYVHENVFAGIRQQISLASTQPDAIHLSGSTQHNEISGNFIGLTMSETPVGVCGRGMYLSEPDYALIEGNRFANTGYSAISLNGVGYDANTLRSNTILQQRAWVDNVQPQPEAAIQLGPSLPSALQTFVPAVVTSINGTKVSGTSSAGSSCPNCVVELFLDDDDGIVEALESLAVVTADSNGNWQANLSHALGANEGLRTTSTSAQYNTIPGLSAGTTTGLSILYLPDQPKPTVEPTVEPTATPKPIPGQDKYGYLPMIVGE